MLQTLTYQYRVKDSKSGMSLARHSANVNFVWNFSNNILKQSAHNYKLGGNPKYVNSFDLNNLLAGSSKELNLHSQTIQAVAETLSLNRKIAKKSSLKWRSRKRGSLGWVPLKASGFQIKDSFVTYQKKKYKFWDSRPLPEDAVIKTGSFSQDSLDHWFFNVTFTTDSDAVHPSPGSAVGIDQGIKTLMTLSDGYKYERDSYTKEYADQLATAQRAHKKRQIKKINLKIKNKRKNYAHQITTKIAKQFETVVVGNIKSQDIIDKGIRSLTKGVYDAGWYFSDTLLRYKTVKFGGIFSEETESYSTQDCSSCSARCGPKGIEDLNIRVWECSSCHVIHDRDVNAARNILKRYISKRDKVSLALSDMIGRKGIPVL